MATAIERAIESLTDPGVEIQDALRGLLVVSNRISATEVSEWLRGELGGYDDGVDIPVYRHAGQLPLVVRFDGYAGSSVTRMLSQIDLPSELTDFMGDVKLKQPVAELSAFCDPSTSEDPQIQMPIWWLGKFRELAEQGQAPRMEMMEVNHAAIRIPRTRLRGMLDRVKSAALDLALGLEHVSLDAGTADGPTVETEPRLQSAVTVHMQHIYATNSSVVIGDNASVTQVQVGDVSGLLEAARSLLSEDGVEALARALEQDGGQPAAHTKSFLSRVRGGAYVLAGGASGNAAYDGLVQLLEMVFPSFA